jgi:hypothetical protein
MLNLCVVENEKDCRLGSARELLNLVDSFLWAWTGPAEPGRLWEYYSAAREKELYDGVDQGERELLIGRYRTSYLARNPNDIFTDWNVQSEIMRDLMRDESTNESQVVRLWGEIVEQYCEVVNDDADV